MTKSPDPIRFSADRRSGWMNQQQPQFIDYLGEDNGELREQSCSKRIRFNDAPRRSDKSAAQQPHEQTDEDILRILERLGDFIAQYVS